MTMNSNDIYSIRPASRHIFTIGRELIQDKYAAILELVKNAYDADSPDVSITFKVVHNGQFLSIIVEDHGHGMSRETVINKWLVPSTDDKLRRKLSPGRVINGELIQRVLQGRKGVGRYAASILGEDLLLETVTEGGEKTSVYVRWDSFNDKDFLDEVEILVETKISKEPVGTRLTINSDIAQSNSWERKDKSDKSELEKLQFELKKLKSPVKLVETSEGIIDNFTIELFLDGVGEGKHEIYHEVVEPFPIFQLFDYKISGKIFSNGEGNLTYSLQKARNSTEESIVFNNGVPTNCGELVFDIRVFDREKEAIEALIARGLKDETGKYVGKLQARRLLNVYNGIGVYRNGFRIRPLGDADFDWLKLNEQRIQQPSMRIGSNQVIGFVQIQSEEQSGLVEKSARDGLHENTAFENLKSITTKIIAELETRRFNYRKKTGLSRPALKLEREFEQLFTYDELKNDIRKKLVSSGMNKSFADEIIEIINRDEENKNKFAEDIRQAVAIYQGQATLGKIIRVILHEGRRPLNYFKNQVPHLHHWSNSYEKVQSHKTLSEILSIADGIEENADVIVKLFGRLDPLAAGKRSKKVELLLLDTIANIVPVFKSELEYHNIEVRVVGPEDFMFSCWKQDLYAIFTNLIDNSVYWMIEKNSQRKEIVISLDVEGGVLRSIDYRDTGPGIEPNLIADEVVFEPEFSTKPGGTGLGLAIAGEAAARNNLELKAYESEDGAYFRLQTKGGE
jgi:signal transduction histidine kinase